MAPRRKRIGCGRRLVVAILILIVGVWGGRRVSNAEWTRAGDPVRVGLIQGNIDQADKWNPARGAAIFQNYLAMTRQAIDRGAGLVLWPESSTPFYFDEARDRAASDLLRALAKQSRVPLLFGSDQIDSGVPTRYYNSAFLIREDGSTGGVYRKMHLVPFGEYVPFKRVLFFAAPLVEAVSDFSAGEDPVVLPVGGHLISTAICYEIVYPESGAPVRPARERAADDDHQRRMVRKHLGSVPAFRASLDARHRGRALPGPVRQYRHQRHRRSLWAGPRSDHD